MTGLNDYMRGETPAQIAEANAGERKAFGPPALDIDNIFRYHAPTPDQLPKYEAIREAARTFAHAIIANTPRGADQSAAIRHLRECVMTANAAVALGGVL